MEQTLIVARAIKAAGAHILRGGAFKPRTSPYSFQGLGEEGLRILAEAREATGLPVVTEALDNEGVDLVERYADAIQIGARNMQNFSLLKRAGRAKKPVLLKRGMSATLEEFLMSAEYILSEGNYDVILCERGVRTFSDFSRNTLDLAIVPAVKKISHLPILVDPSHGTGRREKVAPLSRAAAAVGADGLMIEVHHDPNRALSDGPQSITPDMFAAAGAGPAEDRAGNRAIPVAVRAAVDAKGGSRPGPHLFLSIASIELRLLSSPARSLFVPAAARR